MAYTLQALIAPSGTLRAFPLQPFELVEVTHSVELLPLTKTLRAKMDLPFLPLVDAGETELPVAVHDLFAKASGGTKLAYLEAEYFGGLGTQASLLFQDGVRISQVNIGSDAINAGLRFIGVVARSGVDEFDTIDLGKHRNTEN